MPSQVTILLVRHAQGFHNLGGEFHTLPDPRLTPLGESQCAKLQAEHFPAERQKSISLITASPMTRTLHTAFLSFGSALTMNGKCKPQILAIPDAQETSDFPCDTGSELSVLKDSVAQNGWPVDLSLLDDKWNIKTLKNRYSPASEAIKARARDCRVLLRQKARELAAAGDEDVQIVLVTHGGYLHYLTDDWEDADKWCGTGWDNTESRPFVFEKDFASDDDTNAYILETMDSRRKRGKDFPIAGHDKQQAIFQRMLQGWEDQGLENADKREEVVAAKEENKKEGQEPADLERQVTNAADHAESKSVNTRPPSPKEFISVMDKDTTTEETSKDLEKVTSDLEKQTLMSADEADNSGITSRPATVKASA